MKQAYIQSTEKNHQNKKTNKQTQWICTNLFSVLTVCGVIFISSEKQMLSLTESQF